MADPKSTQSGDEPDEGADPAAVDPAGDTAKGAASTGAKSKAESKDAKSKASESKDTKSKASESKDAKSKDSESEVAEPVGDESTDGDAKAKRKPKRKVMGDLPGQILAREDLPTPADYVVAPDEHEAEELDPEPQPEDPEELAEAQEVADKASSTRPVRRTENAPAKKVTATRTRREATRVEEKRTTPVQFIRESAAELRKVVWPTGAQMGRYFVAVLVFVIVMIAYVGLLDAGFAFALLKLFG